MCTRHLHSTCKGLSLLEERSLRRKTLMRISPTLNVRAVFGPWVISISFQASGHQYRSASLCMSKWCRKLISKWEKIATINRALTFFVAATLRVLGVQRCWGRYRSVLELTSKAPQKTRLQRNTVHISESEPCRSELVSRSFDLLKARETSSLLQLLVRIS